MDVRELEDTKLRRILHRQARLLRIAGMSLAGRQTKERYGKRGAKQQAI
jgi:hypothetical protein